MSAGGLGRATEITTIQYCNNAVNGGRGMFIHNGLVQFTTGYHKGYGQTAKPKIVYRFAPREVSEMVVYFYWCAQPFVEIL